MRHALIALLLGAGLLAGCGTQTQNKPPVAFTAVTEDGWTLSVWRYEPTPLDPTRMPVILCHGLSANDRFYDLAPDVSLARTLQEAGYDVWVPSLRGAGWSTKPPIQLLRQFFRGDLYTAGGIFTSGGRGALKLNWTVDDHIRYDVPTLLDLVRKETKLPQAHWIGHSMGSMIMVAYLDTHPQDDRVASFVGIGTPVFFTPPLNAPLAVLAQARGALEIGNVVLSTSLPALIGLIGGKALITPQDVLFFNADNMTDATVRLLHSAGTEDVSPGQLAQLMDTVVLGRFTSVDGNTDYTADLEKIKTPALFVVGTVDNMAPTDAVKPLYNRWGSTQKQYRLFGVVNGEKADYGHDDLVLGRNARTEVFPTIRKWLDSRNSLVRPPAP